MIKLTFTEQEKQELNEGRYQHEHPRVRQKMEALWLKSQGVSHGKICQYAHISSTTLTHYLKQYEQGGIE